MFWGRKCEYSIGDKVTLFLESHLHSFIFLCRKVAKLEYVHIIRDVT
jgi:hypothetical protein